MSTLSRKQREIAEREELILDVARGILLERGYLGLTMDRIAEATEYSKGTIYQHFANKEEILGVLKWRTLDRQYRVFQRAFAFDGRPRERMTAIGEGYELLFRLEPDDFALCDQIASPALHDKIPDATQGRLRASEQRPIRLLERIVEDGVACGDLVLPEGMQPVHVVFGLWSISDGGFKLARSAIELREFGIDDPFAVLREQTCRLMDGIGWHPLSTEHDYDITTERIRREVFPDEFQRSRIRLG